MRGFTLIELLVAIAVLGVVASALFAAINPVKRINQANDARRKTDLAQIQRALEQFYQDNNGKYPPNSGPSDYRILGFSGAVNWGSSWPPYINVLPKDPKAPAKTYIYISSDGQSYQLYASLDQGGSDPQACNSGGSCSGVLAGVTCGSATDICNYGVSSPNVSP